MAAYDYPYFKLRLTSMGVEAEILRRAKPREVEGLYSWRASRKTSSEATERGTEVRVVVVVVTRECPQPTTRAGIRI